MIIVHQFKIDCCYLYILYGSVIYCKLNLKCIFVLVFFGFFFGCTMYLGAGGETGWTMKLVLSDLSCLSFS
jgi:hypothetical protein